MQNALLIIAIVSILTGMILKFLSCRHMTELGKSLSGSNPKYWFIPPWKSADYYTKKGLQFHMTSVALTLGGLVLYLVGQNW